MKKIILSLLILFSMFPLNGSAATATGAITNFDLSFSPPRNEYILNYSHNSFADNIYVYFETVNGTPYDISFSGIEYVNGRFYLTCNGYYWFYLKRGSTTIGTVTGLITNQITNPGCQSKPPNQNYFDGLNGQFFNNDNNKKIRVNKYNDTNPQLYKKNQNGSYDFVPNSYVDDGNYRNFNITNDGIYRVQDERSGILHDIFEINTTQPVYNNVTNECGVDGCEFLNDVLTCPAWDDYMNEFSDIISSSVPPAPDWDDVALKIKNAINLGSNLNEFKNNLINSLKNNEEDPIQPTNPVEYEPLKNSTFQDLPNPITTDITPNQNDFLPTFNGDGAGAVNLIDPTSWTPDNNDLGYTITDTISVDPGYNPPNSTTDTPPTYNITNPATDTPPTYNITNPATDTPPTYNITNPATDTPPTYNITNPASTTPTYQYN